MRRRLAVWAALVPVGEVAAAQTAAPPQQQPAAAQAVPQLRPPTRADYLRGEYGRYRANNDLLHYSLNVRVDPEQKLISGTNSR